MPPNLSILTINGGSSSIKLALFEPSAALRRTLQGKIQGIGVLQTTFALKGLDPSDNFSHSIVAPDHVTAVGILMDWVAQRFQPGALGAVAHRIVHGGPEYWQPQLIAPPMIRQLHKLSP